MTKRKGHYKAFVKKHGAKPDPNAPVGQGGRFAALAQKTSPAIAAFVGRKKYGKKAFQKMGQHGK